MQIQSGLVTMGAGGWHTRMVTFLSRMGGWVTRRTPGDQRVTTPIPLRWSIPWPSGALSLLSFCALSPCHSLQGKQVI